jgi:glucose/arabinose dehydrogenase
MKNRDITLLGSCAALMLSAACSGSDAAVRIGNAFVATPVANFEEPWAMTFLPDGRLLVSEKKGALKLLNVESKQAGNISGVPKVAYGGQGGFGDVILHPQYASNSIVYVSYSEPGDGGESGAAAARAKLVLDKSGGGKLEDFQVIWRQVPKVQSGGHWGHRLAFGPDGKLWITSSERQKFTPAQDMKSTLGKVVRLNDDGSVPADNPFFAQGGVTAQIWSLGHRNLLGIAFAPDGRLYAHEMGPKGGDELNVIEKGANYGYPIVSNGDHYDGRPIPDHPTRPEFKAPLITWNPVISPAGFIIYTGKMFPDWNGNGFIGGLSSQSLVRVEFSSSGAREVQRFDMGKRIREVEQGPDGAIWLLEDQRNMTGGRLLKLTP